MLQERLADLEHSLAMLAKQPFIDLHVDYSLLSVGQVYMTPADEGEETYSRVRIKRIHPEKVCLCVCVCLYMCM